MKGKLILLILHCFLFIEISHAQPNRSWTQHSPTPSATPAPQPMLPPTAATTAPPTTTPLPKEPSFFDKLKPKCYPETATAYFLPAPPASPKVTVLNSTKDISSILNIKEVPTSSTLASNILSNRGSFSPPPPVQPDLIDEVPTLIQNKLNRMTESDVKVCDRCASLIENLPIFNFDQELLNGFLAGLGF